MAHSKISVRRAAEYLVIAPVSINGRGPFDFVVDTGTNTTLIDPKLAAQTGMQPVDRLWINTPAGKTAAPRYFLDTVSLGAESLSHIEAVAEPLRELSALDHRIRGVLGMNFLEQFSFRLDYKHSLLELFAPDDALEATGGAPIPVEFAGGEMLVRVASNAAPDGYWRLALDTGISQPLLFHNHIHETLYRASNFTATHVATNASEGSADNVTVGDIAIADARLHNLTFVVLREDLSKQGAPGDGLLPAFLFHAIFFDRTHATLIFNPR